MRFAPRRPSPLGGKSPTRADLPAFIHKPIDDIVPASNENERLRLLIIGVNPSPWTAAVNAPFAHPGNRFWPSLASGGILPHIVNASAGLKDSDVELLASRRIGITNIVPDLATTRADELTRDQLRDGAAHVIAKVRHLHPESVAISGITAYRMAFQKPKAALGYQDPRQNMLPANWPIDVPLFVVPQPSGLNAHETIETLGQKWAAVWEFTEGRKGKSSIPR
ncbi:MAG: mismatch-specific DNA-glycosylase [Corynebacterium sp.]|nr:mismatch-specific DNA-glycosylase [Corynebacterium sp.]